MGVGGALPNVKNVLCQECHHWVDNEKTGAIRRIKNVDLAAESPANGVNWAGRFL